MEVVIHGTKGGYRTLFKTSNAPSIASDIRNNSNTETALGKSAYSIAFSNNGIVYTKYTIIRDTLRSSATGTIAFSLFISLYKELINKGADVKSILNDLSNHYMANYVVADNINNGETNKIIQEDWSFVSSILDKEREQDKPQKEIEIKLEQNLKKPAYILYKEDTELEEYLSKPYQEEYKEYEQILFIKSEIRSNISQILEVLRNSGEELGNIDLNNEYYFVSNYDPEKNLFIVLDNKPFSPSIKNYFIREKSNIKLIFKKKYFDQIEVDGTLSNPDSKIYKYLEKKRNQIIINYEVFSQNLNAIEKPIYLDLIKRNGEILEGAEISCKSRNYGSKKADANNILSFSGEEIGQGWTVSARKGDSLYSEEQLIIPDKVNRVAIVLSEHINVKFLAKDADNGEEIKNFKVWVQGKVSTKEISDLVFVGDEVDRTWNITFEKEGYSRSEKIAYYPAAGDATICLDLKKKRKQKQFDGENGANEEKLIGKKPFLTQYKIITLSLVFVIILAAVFALAFYLLKDPKQPQLSQNEIQNYVEDIQLNLDILNNYNSEWKEQKPEIINSGGNWWSIFGIGSKEQYIDSTDYKEWEVTSYNLDSAILKREFIDNGIFSELTKYHYYGKQLNFKDALKLLDSSTFKITWNQLSKENIPNLSLDEIANKIDSLVKVQDPNYLINSYLEGIELDIDTLNNYINKAVDPTLIQNIEKAIALRNNLNKGELSKIDELGYEYSQNQVELNNAMNLINESNKRFLGDEMNRDTISKMNLDQIAKLINNKIKEFNNTSSPKKENTDAKESIAKQSNSIDQSREITNQLQATSNSQIELEKANKKASDQEKNSIKIYLKFWKLVLNGDKDLNEFEKILQEVNNDPILKKNSELKTFLDKICKNIQDFNNNYSIHISKVTKTPSLTLQKLEETLK